MSLRDRSDQQNTTFKDRLKDWCDHYVFNDTTSMFRGLVIVTVMIILILSLILFATGENDFYPVLWDTIATMINAWMPYSEDGGAAYIIVMAIGAVIGILFTSLLIGIMTTAVEDKLSEIREGNGKVIEENHIVVMGLNIGLYCLLRELIQVVGKRKMTILVAGEEDKETVLEGIKENVEIPEHVSVRYRKVDVCDPIQLECLSLPTASKVIMNHGDDVIAMKCILAISSITSQYERKPDIVAIIHDESNISAFKEAGKGHKMLTLQSYKLIARIIAHASVQPRLSYVFNELFGFTGNDFYFDEVRECNEMTFAQITQCIDHAIPVGYKEGNRVVLNPSPDYVFKKRNQLIYLATNKKGFHFNTDVYQKSDEVTYDMKVTGKENHILVIGTNHKTEDIYEELELIGSTVTEIESIDDLDQKELKQKLLKMNHIIILGGKAEDEMDDDEIIRTVLILKSFREELHTEFNITVEMTDEKNEALIRDDDMDIIIASNFSNMVIAQLVGNPDRLSLFKELLSTTGNEIFTVSMNQFFKGAVTVKGRDLRNLGMRQGMIVLGYRKKYQNHVMINDLDKEYTLNVNDVLIVIAPRKA